MPASLTRITDMVTALLNAGTRSIAGVPNYTSAIGDNARSAAEISETCIQAAIKTAQAICESDSHPFRVPFLADTALTHGNPIPFHFGGTSVPTIVPFSGAAVTKKGVRRAFDRIESMRINRLNTYGAVAHDQAGTGNVASPLSGYYDIVNGIFYFTGFSASMKLADFDRTDVISKLDEAVEPTIVRLAAGLSAKDGDSSDSLFQSWLQHGLSDLAEIKNGAMAFAPVDNAIQIRGDRVS